MKRYLVFMLLMISKAIYAHNTEIDKRFILEQKLEKIEGYKLVFFDFQELGNTLEKEYESIKKLVINKRYTEGLRLTFKLYDKSKTNNNKKVEFLSIYLLGEIYRLTKNYDKALISYKKSIKLLDSDKNFIGEFQNFTTLNYAKNLLRLGTVFQNLSKNDSALHYYKKLDLLSSSNDEVLNLKAISYTNLSGIYQRDLSFEKAYMYANLAIKIHGERNNKISEANSFNNLANIYLVQRDFIKSKKTYNDAIELIKKDSSIRAIQLKGSLYFNLAWAMRNLKEYKAYDQLEISYNLKDSLRNDEVKKTIERIQGEYNVNNVRQEEQLKTKVVEVKKQKAQRNTWILGISSLSIIISLAFFLNQYKLRQKNLKLELLKLETESQIEILNASIKGEEKERKRISQELHDGILGRLFGSRMGLGYLELKADEESQNQYQKFLEELQNIEKEIREVSHKLNNDVTRSEASFINAINQLLREKRHIGDFEFKLNVSENFSLTEHHENLQMHLFRILQECLQNILKHAKAKRVTLDFKIEKENLVFQIKDDGVGFDTTKTQKGIGLKNIKSRIEKLQGRLNISSEKDKGTLIDIQIPIV